MTQAGPHHGYPTRVHRKRVKLARRAHKVATALERRGVVATYALHDRLLSNRASRRRFTRSSPALDDLQRSLVETLDREGFVTLRFAELFDEETWQRVLADGSSFRERTAAALADPESAEATELRTRPGKEFVVRKLSYGVTLDESDPWFAAALSHRMLDVANAYLRMLSKLEYVDMWFSVPQPEDAKRVASQRWHRDFNDRHLLKAFVYLVDVDERMGPFQYVSGSAGAGPYAGEWAWRPLGENYPAEDELERRVAPEQIHKFTAPAGTLILCNTSGFHRGGLSTSDPRVLATATYSSPASLASLTERSYTYAGSLDRLDPPQRYAVS